MRHIITFFICTMFALSLPAFSAKPDNKTAAEITNRLVSLYESTALTFSKLEDKILDDVARDISFTALSPETTINKNERPNLFIGDKSKYDSAIPKSKAANVAAYFFGRPAPLADEDEYIYGYAHDGALLCHAQIENITEETENTATVQAALVCEPEPDAKAKREGDLIVRLEKLQSAPLGWTVLSFTVDKTRK